MEHKLSELIEFNEYYKINGAWTWVNLKIFLLPISCWLCGNIMAYYTGGCKFE